MSAPARKFPLTTALLEADARVAWRPFTKEDWFGLAGAESFQEEDASHRHGKKHEPLIAELMVDGCESIAVLDRNGLCVMIYEKVTEDGEFDNYKEQTFTAEGMNAARIAVQLRRATNIDELVELGLQELL